MSTEGSQKIIVGLGKSGLSVARYFDRQGCSYGVMDQQEPPAETLSTISPEWQGWGQYDEKVLTRADLIVISPGVPRKAIEELGVDPGRIVGDIELFLRANKKPVVAVTGTNGKSTVVRLVEDVLNAMGTKAVAIGNIGEPALDHLDDEVDCYVLELSSYQLESIQSLRNHIACITNIAPDHLERYESFEAYAAVKQHIYDNARIKIDLEAMGWSLKPGKFSAMITHHGEELGSLSDCSLIGKHNAINILNALAICDALSIDVKPCYEFAKAFSGLPHRCQLIHLDKQGVMWVDDSKATNVAATIAAVNSLASSEGTVLILGGQPKAEDYQALISYISSKVRVVILFGQAREMLAPLCEGCVEYYLAEDFADTVSIARKLKQTAGCILFSPACASFDEFKNFEERGEMFRQCVIAKESSHA